MKLQFKIQSYQTAAVEAVVKCFAGQRYVDGVRYRIDPGSRAARLTDAEDLAGLKNHEINAAVPLLKNVQDVQWSQNLPVSDALVGSGAGPLNLDVEMETGTGKTYVYIKTMMELHKQYGWSKFIVVVPSVAIREGVKKTFDVTADHFQETYGTKPRSFIYNSSRLHELESFSSDAGVQVMIINIQAFNSRGQDNRRIYDVLDDFQSRRPIDVIAANRPIVVIDEPQKIGSAQALSSLSNFRPLFLLRYSATHKVEHNKVYRLDALDAYNQKLVKKIAPVGITVKGLAGSTAYIYLERIEVKAGTSPTARVELEVQTKGGGIKRQMFKLQGGARLHDITNGVEAYRDLVVINVDATTDVIVLSNGDEVFAGQLTADVTEDAKRRIQIREVIQAHLARERALFAQGIKVLSLFFIDEVVKYRDYSRDDTLGDYARVFEEEYGLAVSEVLSELPFGDEAYRSYLDGITANETHQGYFSIDKKSRHFVEGEVSRSGDDKGQSKDVDAYDLILKNKERLLSFEEKVRFIFSHSALREGWDNPNVFTMGLLKRSDNTVSRRQEIGRGLRLAVNQEGERIDDPASVHDINELTVVTDESYTAFVTGLQREISESLSSRPRKASEEYFTGKVIKLPIGDTPLTKELAKALYKYLVKNDYINDDDTIAEAYKVARDAGTLAEPTSEDLKPIIDYVWPIIDALYLGIPTPPDGRKAKPIPLNKNFEKDEFLELWDRINHKAVYQVEFDSEELIGKCVTALDAQLKVARMQYVVESGIQKADLEAEDLADGQSFKVTSSTTKIEAVTAASQVEYDLLGEITEKTQLTRRTAAAILTKIKPATFAMFRQNPEQFITESARLINEQKATVIVEHLTYDSVAERFDKNIFTANQTATDFTKAGDKLKKHIYDYVITDSTVERDFVTNLDTGTEVEVYAKLPRGFFIPTPVGNYNPDWAIAFKEGTVKHVYFIAETKGSLSTMQLREVEKSKIECARKFFAELTAKAEAKQVKYDVVTDYGQLRALVAE